MTAREVVERASIGVWYDPRTGKIMGLERMYAAAMQHAAVVCRSLKELDDDFTGVHLYNAAHEEDARAIESLAEELNGA